MHTRDFPGFLDSARKLLTLAPSNIANWTKFALGAYLNKKYEEAVKATDSMLKFDE